MVNTEQEKTNKYKKIEVKICPDCRGFISIKTSDMCKRCKGKGYLDN